MEKKFATSNELMKWLKSTSSAVLITISLAGGVQETQIQASSAKALINMASSAEYYGQGPFLVQYQESKNDEQEVPYTAHATAFTFKGHLAQHPEQSIGGMDDLREKLSGFEYIAKVNLEKSGYVGHLLIVIPKNPEEIENLKNILHNLSIAYIFPDNSGTINKENFKMGSGLWA